MSFACPTKDAEEDAARSGTLLGSVAGGAGMVTGTAGMDILVLRSEGSFRTAELRLQRRGRRTDVIDGEHGGTHGDGSDTRRQHFIDIRDRNPRNRDRGN